MTYTAVFDGVFVDIKGFPDGKFQPEGRNTGEVKIVHGGVCRNVAENMANISCEVSLVTMLSEDEIGEAVRRRLLERSVDLRFAVSAADGRGTWLVVLNEKGEPVASISKQPEFSALEALIDARGDEIMCACDAVVLEMDMCASIAEKVMKLAQKHERDVYVVVGNMSVMLERKDLLSRAKLVILNENEAGHLFDCEMDRHAPQALLEFVRREAKRLGLREIVVTLGDQGAVYLDTITDEAGYIPAEQAKMVDSTGAGDAFFSGTVAARAAGLPLSQAAQMGNHLAALTIQTDESSCPKMEHFLPFEQ